MDIKGLRTLNLVGTILYCLIGSFLAFVYYYETYSVYTIFNRDITGCTISLIIWISILISFTIELFMKTVVGLDRGDYKTAKQWTLVGIIVGFMGGIIPLIIFIISYVSFDDAVRTQQFGPPYYSYYQQPGQLRYCISCRKQIPVDSRLCPYCGRQQLPIHSYPTPPPPRRDNRKMKYY